MSATSESKPTNTTSESKPTNTTSKSKPEPVPPHTFYAAAYRDNSAHVLRQDDCTFEQWVLMVSFVATHFCEYFKVDKSCLPDVIALFAHANRFHVTLIYANVFKATLDDLIKEFTVRNPAAAPTIEKYDPSDPKNIEEKGKSFYAFSTLDFPEVSCAFKDFKLFGKGGSVIVARLHITGDKKNVDTFLASQKTLQQETINRAEKMGDLFDPHTSLVYTKPLLDFYQDPTKCKLLPNTIRLSPAQFLDKLPLFIKFLNSASPALPPFSIDLPHTTVEAW